RERARAGDAVVVVLHDLGLAAAYAHRVAVLRGGRVAADGPPAEVFCEALLTEVYDQPVEVLPHPRTGTVLVTPKRSL
ncbi:hemin ABC transporter ATP-binding protein, partial [Streptomyces sp. SID9944]|nr:hemin ABC transporter ATP-binding protein [Streptomyces sp. SID9944]